MKRPLEVVVLVGVLLTVALVAIKVTGFRHRSADSGVTVVPVPSVATEEPVASAAPRPFIPATTLKEILAKIQSGAPLTIAEQRELDRIAAENGQGAALATAIEGAASKVPADDAKAITTKDKKTKRTKSDGRSYGDMTTAELVASLKQPGKIDEKSDAFVKTLPNLTADQQRSLSAKIQKKAASRTKDGDAADAPSGALFEYNMNRAKHGQPPVDALPVAMPVAVPAQD